MPRKKEIVSGTFIKYDAVVLGSGPAGEGAAMKLAKSGKLENIKITDSNIKDFLQTAKKYDIDFALKKDKSTSPATYHIFFESSHTENFKKAFSEYALGIKKSFDKKSVTQVVNREQIKQNAKTISRQQADKSVEKSKNKSDMGR